MRKNEGLMTIVVVALVIFALTSVALSVGSCAGPTPTQTPAPAGSCNWSGTWQTNWGEMVLSQAGTQVSGSYTHDAGRITGTLSGSTLIGTWSEAPSYSPPNDAGDVQLTIAADCNSFTGIWRYGSSGDWLGDWTGTRTGAAPTPTPTITPNLDSDGDGVPDGVDQCLGTPAGVAVDDKGCPVEKPISGNLSALQKIHQMNMDIINKLKNKPTEIEKRQDVGMTIFKDPSVDQKTIKLENGEIRVDEIKPKIEKTQSKIKEIAQKKRVGKS